MKKLLLLFLFLLVTGHLFAQIRMGQNRKFPVQSNEISYSNPKEYEIAEIKVVGLETLNENAIISLAGLAVGDKIKIPGDDITTALKNIWGQGIIADVSIYVNKIEEERVFLEIRLTERPRLTSFTFEGINKTQQGELKDKISLFRGRVLTDAIMKNTELSVKKYFVDKGFLNANVKLVQERDTLARNSVQLKVVVDKNQKVKIKRIAFDGNDNFGDYRLRKKMKSTKEKIRFTLFRDMANRLWNLEKETVKDFVDTTRDVTLRDVRTYLSDHVKLNFLTASKFIKADYETDKKLIIDFYNSHGYRDAKIVEDSIYKVGHNSINLDIKVEEGIKYYFRDIIWSGNYVYTDERLSSTLGVQKGDVYDMEKVNKKLNYDPQGADISSLYMDNGYLLGFSVTPVEISVEGDSIDVEMRITEGPQATINKVIIKGNDVTNDHVILREIRTFPGQKFSRSDVIRTQRELSQLGYFDPEQIGIQPVPTPDGNVDMEYTLVEKGNDQIELSGGWGGAFGFVGTLGLVFNNFSIKGASNLKNWRPIPKGDGQKLALRMQANGARFQSYSATFSEPWLGGKRRNAFTVNLSHSVQRQIPFGSREQVGGLQVTGATVSLGRSVKWPDDFFVVSNSLSYLLYNIDRFQIPLGFENNTGKAHSFTFNTTIQRSSIDNPIYPRGGSQLSLSANFTPPYSLFMDTPTGHTRIVEYHKWMFDSRNYITLAGNLVLETRAHLGFIGSYGKERITGFERFTLGGVGLAGQGQMGNFILARDLVGLRGYDDGKLAPVEGTGSAAIAGGVVFNKFVVELRYPISLAQAAQIYVLGFGEAGNTWNNYAEFNPYNMKKAAGVGARISMAAFGLIGIDWAYGFDRLPGQLKPSGSQFHFSIGQQIR
ncbi:MAG: outer membrane protein assembly factor BamA [Bacteroidota bacterium]|nr:outer membrane protein assembly factor BamA [Bacteroidota bacterium]